METAMANRYYAEQVSKRHWKIMDRLQARCVENVYSEAEPRATVRQLNEHGYVEAD